MATGMELQVLSVAQHEQFLSNKLDRLNKWCLPAANMRADALVRHALHEMSIDAKLQSCTPTSIYLALMACAVTGLVPGKIKSLAFLIPFNNTKKIVDDKGNGREVTETEATFMPGWRGIKLTGFRAGLDMVSAVIHQNDDFDFDKGSTPFVRYKPALRGSGPVIGTACWVKLPRGGLEVEFLDMETLGKIEMAAKAKSGGKSPAWDGPFKDQMQRKSALRRLGKQIEMGEDFHRAELIQNSQDTTGSTISAIDEITDGDATRLLAAASTESAVFSAPRAQVQVTAQIEETKPAPAPAKTGTRGTTGSAKTPTAPEVSTPSSTKLADSSGPNTSSNDSKASSPSAKLDDAKAKVEAKRPPAAPTSQNASPAMQAAGGTSRGPSVASPTAGAAGSTSAAPAASPAASSASSSPTAAPASTAPAIDTTATESSASSDEAGEFGDVAGEPGADEDFDASFGDDEEAPQDPPTTRQGWVGEFQSWAEAHPTREHVLADDSWKEIFQSWANACHTKAELDEDKQVFVSWAREKFSVGRKADPLKNITAIAPDPGSMEMQKMFAARYKAVP